MAPAPQPTAASPPPRAVASPPAAAAPPPPPEQPPAAQPAPVRAKRPAIIVGPDDETVGGSFVRGFFTGAGLSLLVHFALLLAAALWVFDVHGGAVGITAAFTGEEQAPLDSVLDPSDLTDGGAASALVAPPTETVVVDAESLLAAIPPAEEVVEPESGESEGEGETLGSGTTAGGGTAGGGERKQEENIPGNAVRAGNFTVWTRPEDPLPGRPYLIVVQLDLPDHIRQYPRSDLRGSVVGTDGYEQRFPGRGDSRRYFPIRNGRVQTVIKVPPAQALVKDIVKVRSGLLGESQVLELVF